MSSDPAADAVAALERAIHAAPAGSPAALLLPVLDTLRASVAPTNNVALVAALATQLADVAGALAQKPAPPPSSAGGGGADASSAPLPAFDPSDVLCSSREPVSFAQPRGRFLVHALRSGAFALESPGTAKTATRFIIKHADVRAVLNLAVGDSNDTTNVMIALDPAAAIRVGKTKTVAAIVAQARLKDKAALEIVLPGDGKTYPPGFEPTKCLSDVMAAQAELLTEHGGGNKRVAPPGLARDALAAMLSFAAGKPEAASPSAKTFASAKNGRQCVSANVKFDQGHLFFLKDGFAFVDKPAAYLPFDDLVDLRLLRADGAGGSFDLTVTARAAQKECDKDKDGGEEEEDAAKGGEVFEFANIARDELEGVRRYLAKRTQAAGAEGGEGGEGGEEESDEDESDASDEDFGVDEEDSDEEESDEDGEDEDGDGDSQEASDDAAAGGRGGEEEEEEEEEDEDSEEASDGGSGGGRKRAREDAGDSIPAVGGGGASDDEEEEEEEEDSDDDDGAFEVVPVAKAARQ